MDVTSPHRLSLSTADAFDRLDEVRAAVDAILIDTQLMAADLAAEPGAGPARPARS